MDYITIACAYFYISQYKSREDFISKVVNIKLVMRELSSVSQVVKTVLDAKQAHKEFDELENLLEVKKNDTTLKEENEKNEKSKENGGSKEFK